MTDVMPNPKARVTRLYARAREIHEKISRLAEDLQPYEGQAEALGAQDSLSSLCYILEGYVNAGQ